MYNRYMQSSFAGDTTAKIDYIPVIRHEPCETCEEPTEQQVDKQEETVQESIQNAEEITVSKEQTVSENTKSKESFLGNLLNFKDFNIETIGVIVLALFLLCDKPEDSTNSIILLVLLVLLGF